MSTNRETPCTVYVCAFVGWNKNYSFKLFLLKQILEIYAKLSTDLLVVFLSLYATVWLRTWTPSTNVPVFVCFCTSLQKTLCPIRFEYLLIFLNFRNVVLESKIVKVTPGVRPMYLFKIIRNICIYTDCKMNSVKNYVITFYGTPVPSQQPFVVFVRTVLRLMVLPVAQTITRMMSNSRMIGMIVIGYWRKPLWICMNIWCTDVW